MQGYGDNSELIDHPGEQRSYYHWSGTGQMFSSPRDMAIFLAANLGELPTRPALSEAIALAHSIQMKWGAGSCLRSRQP